MLNILSKGGAEERIYSKNSKIQKLAETYIEV
jgi:hypothetical protein